MNIQAELCERGDEKTSCERAKSELAVEPAAVVVAAAATTLDRGLDKVMKVFNSILPIVCTPRAFRFFWLFPLFPLSRLFLRFFFSLAFSSSLDMSMCQTGAYVPAVSHLTAALIIRPFIHLFIRSFIHPC